MGDWRNRLTLLLRQGDRAHPTPNHWLGPEKNNNPDVVDPPKNNNPDVVRSCTLVHGRCFRRNAFPKGRVPFMFDGGSPVRDKSDK